MRAEFSEFTYGFSLVSELATSLGCQAVPIFPSLKMEGQTCGGYDVEMDFGAIPFFLQFKLAEHLKTNNAKEAKLSAGTLNAPYRRFPITSSVTSKQHEMLVGLNAQHDHVYYCAPNFYLNADLNHLWQHGFVSDHSVFVNPSNIGPITDGARHAVCYNQASLSSGTCYLFSTPKPVTAHAITNLQTQLDEALRLSDIPIRALIPKWLSGLSEARAQAQELHRKRVVAIHEAREEARARDRETGFIDEDELEYLALRRPDTLTRVIEPQEDLPIIPRPGTADAKPEDPDRERLSEFARRVASEFHAQTFVLQR
ncbi:hypothetical protein [Labrenzia sp. DG1229]|uniref:hypothetical protein n=1 Tax=Labrenzia sp. DG1229 TaxID=681847 RepID=UPI000491624D|nr:hypothetical protein [Labrenzia sp. DG1229]